MSAKIQKYGYLSLFLLPSLGLIKKNVIIDAKRILKYLKLLMANNNREWYQAHKGEYDADVLLAPDETQTVVMTVKAADEHLPRSHRRFFVFLHFIYQSTTNLSKHLCLYGLARWW